MKKLLGMILTLALAAAGLASPVYAESSAVPPEVTAHAYLVMDAQQTGQVLVQKGGAERNYPASITKIMTLALAMEKCGGDMTQQVTVSPDAVYSLEAGSSHVALQPGEVVSLNDLFHATILASANDAANVLAEYTAGSMEAFVELMNAKAAELGLAGTHFVNANGLHSADHYTTPYDMARLTQWAMTVPGFSELFGATSYTMQPTNKQEQERLFGTDNCMLVTNKYQYEGTTGGKSGWTEEAGYTMVETVTRSGRSPICVVMGSAKKYDKFSDSIALLDYCFDHFTPVTLAAFRMSTSPQVPVYYAEGAPSVGSAPLALSVEGYTFLLHSALAADDVQVTFDTPERYMVDEPFTAATTVSLREGLSAGSCMNREIGVYALGIDETAVSALLDANAKEFVERRPPGGRSRSRCWACCSVSFFYWPLWWPGASLMWRTLRRSAKSAGTPPCCHARGAAGPYAPRAAAAARTRPGHDAGACARAARSAGRPRGRRARRPHGRGRFPRQRLTGCAAGGNVN